MFLRKLRMHQKTYSRRKSVIPDEPTKIKASAEGTPNSSMVNSGMVSSSKRVLTSTIPEKEIRADIRSFFEPIDSIPKFSEEAKLDSLPQVSATIQRKRRLKFAVPERQVQPSKSSGKPIPHSRPTRQRVLKLGKDFTQCKICGMVYAFWEKKSHELYHKRSIMEFNPLIKCEKATIYGQEFQGKRLCIQVLNRNTDASLRKFGEKALQFSSDNGLEMEQIDPEVLWELTSNPHDPCDPLKVFRFKLYTMFHDNKLAALLLAERIGYGVHEHEISKYMEGDNPSKQDLYIERAKGYPSKCTKQKVYMSVERIWVHEGYQRQGLATMLLDQARQNFFYPLSLARNEVAISWPTEAGKRFFSRYFRGAFSESLENAHSSFLVNLSDTSSLLKDK
ncbi:BgTH12-00383 [Blumeria graminis f. sp. triticale]|nr:BgTH12-00383 [Blumeria graminis f. sp. triticale]